MMTRHYIKIAFRNLLKYRTQSIISIIGLAIGFASFALSGLWIRHEMTYDSFHKDADRIYRADNKTNMGDGKLSRITSLLLADHLKQNFPEIEQACFVSPTGRMINDKMLPALEIDSTFFSMLPVTIIAGNPQFLYTPNEVAITEKAAKRIFGDQSPIGEQTEKGETITAIIKNWEGHSNFQYDILALEKKKSPNWGIQYGQTLVKVKKGIDIKSLQEKLSKMEVTFEQRSLNISTIITPLTEIHYMYPATNTLIQLSHIRLFCLISLLVVLSALLNYLIMYLIRIRMRYRELALRKVNGASNRSLTTLLMSELTILLALALLGGLFFIEITLPAFKRLSQIDQDETFFYKEGLLYLGLATGITFLFSMFTLLSQRHFARQSSINSISGKHLSSLFRKVGLWLQLTISIGFIFCTVVMMKQLHYLQTTDSVGITNKKVGIVTGEVQGMEPEAFDKIMHQIPSIEAIGPNYIPFYVNTRITYNIEWEGKKENDPSINADQFPISEESFHLFGLTLTQGDFPKEFGEKEIFINESLAKAVGWKEAIGKKINEHTVVGVLKDIQLSPTTPVRPTYYVSTEEYPSYTFGYQGSLKEARMAISEYILKEHTVFIPDFTSPEKILEEALTSENALMQLLATASTICILTAFFGIFSLVSLFCEQRRKEIAIRKVNGATIPDILNFFIKEYAVLLILSALTAFPISYVLMKRWLEIYTKQIEISFWIYISIMAAIILIVFISVGWKVWKAAGENPAEVIKSE